MLVLARRVGDSIIIGEDVEITVVEVSGDKVKLGISAPKEITVLRRELVDAAKAANKEAASPEVELSQLTGLIGPAGGARGGADAST